MVIPLCPTDGHIQLSFIHHTKCHIVEKIIIVSLTLSNAIGLDSFSIGAETEDVDAAFDAADALDIIELIDEKDDWGRSVYKTSWLFADGIETAVVAILAVFAVCDADDTSINDKFSLSLSGGTLTLDDVGSMARDT